MGGALDIVALVDFHLLVEDVADHHEVDLPSGALVLHLVQAVDPHEEGLRVLADVLNIVAQNLPQFLVLLPTDRLHDDLGVLGVVDEAAALALGGLVGEGGQVAHEQVADEIFQADALEELRVIDIEVFPDEVKNLGGVVYENLADFLDRSFVVLVDEVVVVLAVEVLFGEGDHCAELVVVGLEASADA